MEIAKCASAWVDPDFKLQAICSLPRCCVASITSSMHTCAHNDIEHSMPCMVPMACSYRLKIIASSKSVYSANKQIYFSDLNNPMLTYCGCFPCAIGLHV